PRHHAEIDFAEGKIALLHHALGINYPAELLQKIIMLARQAFMNSASTDNSVLSIFTRSLANQAFIDHDMPTLYAQLVLASLCQTDSTNEDAEDQFIKRCQDKLLDFTETLTLLIRTFAQGSAPIDVAFINALLFRRSLLRKTIMICLELNEEQMQNQATFLAALQEKAVKPLETKLEEYTQVVDACDADRLAQPHNGINLLHKIIEDLSPYIMSPQRETAITHFMRGLFDRLNQKGILVTLVNFLTDENKNFLHCLVEKTSFSFLIRPLRESLNSDTFGNLCKVKDNKHHAIPLHFAFALRNARGFAEIIAGMENYVDLLITPTTDYAVLFTLLRSSMSENAIAELRSNNKNILTLLLQKLAESVLASEQIVERFIQFCKHAEEELLLQLLAFRHPETQETVMHILAKSKTLQCLLPIFTERFPHAALCDLLMPDTINDTPLHTAIRFKNLEFIVFCRKIDANSSLRACGKYLSKEDESTVFHLVPHSCFNDEARRVQAIFDGRQAFPEIPLSRKLLSNLVVDNTPLKIMNELLAIFGEEESGSYLRQKDCHGNNVLHLCCYLDNPELINCCMAIGYDQNNYNFSLLATIANQPLHKSLITPLQMLMMIGSADSVSKLMFMLGTTAQDACLQRNDYLGGRNALGCCYVSRIDSTNDDERQSLLEVFNALMSAIPQAVEYALLCQMQPEITPIITSSLLQDRCIGYYILEQGGNSTHFSQPVALMMDILYEPYTPLLPINDLRNKLLKRIFLYPFIPGDILETMVSLVTKIRIELKDKDRDTLLLTLLLKNLHIPMNHPSINLACLFLALSCPVSRVENALETEYCQRFAKKPDISAGYLRDLIAHFDEINEVLGEQYLQKIFHSNSLLKKSIILAFFEGKDAKDEEQFISKLYEIIHPPQFKRTY
nr:hypothetical protein [Pseudomonadota bacterium]